MDFLVVCLIIYLIIAMLVYVVPPFFGIDFDGDRLPSAVFASVFWFMVMPIWLSMEIGAVLETWRKKVIAKRR